MLFYGRRRLGVIVGNNNCHVRINGKNVKEAVKDVGGARNLPVKIIHPGRQTYNKHTDKINWEIHAFLMQLETLIVKL